MIIISESLLIEAKKDVKINHGAGIIPVCKKTGKLLLQKRGRYISSPNLWGSWGGMGEKGETPRQTALREFEEESGYTGSILKMQHVFTDTKRDGFKFYNYFVTVPKSFTPSTIGKKTTDGDIEVQDYKWLTFDELKKFRGKLHPGIKKILRNNETRVENFIKNYCK